MRFLVDECTGPAVANWLKNQGYKVFSVYDQARGISEDAVIERALSGNWILTTNNKDFGEKSISGKKSASWCDFSQTFG